MLTGQYAEDIIRRGGLSINNKARRKQKMIFDSDCHSTTTTNPLTFKVSNSCSGSTVFQTRIQLKCHFAPLMVSLLKVFLLCLDWIVVVVLLGFFLHWKEWRKTILSLESSGKVFFSARLFESYSTARVRESRLMATISLSHTPKKSGNINKTFILHMNRSCT